MKISQVWVPAEWFRVERPWSTHPICWFFGHDMELVYPDEIGERGDFHKWECERCGRAMGTMGPFFNSSAFFYLPKKDKGEELVKMDMDRKASRQRLKLMDGPLDGK